MNAFARGIVTMVSGIAAFYFTFWVGGAFLLLVLHAPGWSAFATPFGAAAAVGRYVWIYSASISGLVSAAVLGGLVIGGVGFSAGFFGPLIFTPGANQGPLLGVFITGPLDLVIGALAGAVYWLVTRTRRA